MLLNKKKRELSKFKLTKFVKKENIKKISEIFVSLKPNHFI